MIVTIQDLYGHGVRMARKRWYSAIVTLLCGAAKQKHGKVSLQS
jgi:hypothetical protein